MRPAVAAAAALLFAGCAVHSHTRVFRVPSSASKNLIGKVILIKRGSKRIRLR